MWTSQSVVQRQKACPVARRDGKRYPGAFTGRFGAPVPEQQPCHAQTSSHGRAAARTARSRARRAAAPPGQPGAPLLMTAEQQRHGSETAERCSANHHGNKEEQEQLASCSLPRLSPSAGLRTSDRQAATAPGKREGSQLAARSLSCCRISIDISLYYRLLDTRMHTDSHPHVHVCSSTQTLALIQVCRHLN